MVDIYHTSARDEIGESKVIRVLLIFISIGFLTAVVLFPLVVVFMEGLRKGWEVFTAAFTEPDTLTEHILLGGAPRSIAILNGTLAAAIGLGLPNS